MIHNYKAKLDKAISLGQRWMKQSQDPMHDYTHAENVCNIGLEIYQELKSNFYPDLDCINNELVQIVAWWHDCFKATQTKHSLINDFLEGPRSSKIIRKELEPYLNQTDMKIVTDAVTNHAGFGTLIYLLRPKAFSPLFKILMESDAYDMLDLDRKKRFLCGTTSKIPLGLIFIELTGPILFPIYLRTRTARKNLYKRMLRFYEFWLWKERQIVRLLFPT